MIFRYHLRPLVSGSVHILEPFVLFEKPDGSAKIPDIRGQIDVHIPHDITVIELNSLAEGHAHAPLPHSHIGDLRVFLRKSHADLRRLIIGAVVR